MNSGYEYIILTASDYYDKIIPLAQWRCRKGLKTKIFKIEDEIGSNPTQDQIKMFIKLQYNNPENNLKYVLLVGDNDKIPMASGHYNNNPERPDWDGDYWYSDLYSDNYTFRNSYDRSSPPELSIGRISVNNSDGTAVIVNKILKYEQTPPAVQINGIPWEKRVLNIAHFETHYYDDKGIAHDLHPTYQENKEDIANDYNDNLIFIPIYGSEDKTNDDISNGINTGVGIVNYRGHGGNGSWSGWNNDQEDYGERHVIPTPLLYNVSDDLCNLHKTPIIFSIACWTNNFLNYNLENCLGEYFIKKENGGAVAFLGAANYSPTFKNSIYDEYLFDAIFSQQNQLYKLGLISNYAATQVLSDAEDESIYLADTYLWLGDPAMKVWTDEPQEITGVTINYNESYISVDVGSGYYDICVCSGDLGET
ncbi:hypothetical protein J7K93_02780, partial [bacterium]|nr:hypothetical protein [bacterium]